MEGKELAPQSGHVSNFCCPNGTVIEPVDGHCFQSDPCELLAGVHGGHPVGTRPELAKGPVISGCAVIRPQTARIAYPWRLGRIYVLRTLCAEPRAGPKSDMATTRQCGHSIGLSEAGVRIVRITLPRSSRYNLAMPLIKLSLAFPRSCRFKCP